MNRSDIIKDLKKRDVLVEGSRNNDAVNLAIVAYSDDPSIASAINLVGAISRLIKNEELSFDESTSDWEYLVNKAPELMKYLPQWYDTGDIYSYAII